MGLDAGVGRLMFWDPSSIVGSPSYNDGVGRFIFWDLSCVVDSPSYHDQCDVIIPLTKVQQGRRKKVSQVAVRGNGEQAKPKAKWEEESKMLKHSDVSRVEQKC